MSAARRRQRATRVSRQVLYREAVYRAASIDEEARTAEFVASTENPVRTWMGPEVLRMSGARLKRFKKNPVVLDSHNSWSIKSILGTAEAWVDGRLLRTKVRFDETDEGEAAWKRVKSGSLRAVSIGYRPNRAKTTTLAEGQTDGKGDALVAGPALVCREWELMEITLCPVPADEDAVRRSFYDHRGRGRTPGGPMARSSFSYPARQPEGDDVDDDQELDLDEDEQPEAERAPAPKPKRAPAPPKPDRREAELRLLPAERAAREAEALYRHAMTFTPKELEHVVRDAIRDGATGIDEIREAVKKASAKNKAPLGVAEPQDATKKDEGSATREAPLPEDLTDDVFARSIQNLRG